MKKLIISLPKNLTLNSVLSFKNDLQSAPICERIVFDCSNLSYVEPFAMVLAASEIKKFKKARHNTTFATRNRATNSYANHMGLFTTAGLTRNSGRTNEKGNSRYVPITKINCNKIKDQAYEEGCHPCDLIEEDANQLAEILARTDHGPLFDLFKFTTLEMMRNVIEHSEANSFLYCGQYWPSKDRVEIGILDAGIGLRTSLEKNPKYENITDDQALNLAITPGVSSTVYMTGKRRGNWTNAGFGLYMTSRFCCEGGSFSLLSGSVGIVKSSIGTTLVESNITGTGVRLILRPSKIGNNIDEMFELFRSDATKLSHAKQTDLGRSPSTILKRTKIRK